MLLRHLRANFGEPAIGFQLDGVGGHTLRLLDFLRFRAPLLGNSVDCFLPDEFDGCSSFISAVAICCAAEACNSATTWPWRLSASAWTRAAVLLRTSAVVSATIRWCSTITSAGQG